MEASIEAERLQPPVKICCYQVVIHFVLNIITLRVMKIRVIISSKVLKHMTSSALNFDTLMNPYSKVRGQISGVINESDYRSRDRGFVPERMNLIHE